MIAMLKKNYEAWGIDRRWSYVFIRGADMRQFKYLQRSKGVTWIQSNEKRRTKGNIRNRLKGGINTDQRRHSEI